MIIKMLMFPVVILLVLYFVIAQVVPTAKAVSATKQSIEDEQKKLVAAEQQLTDVTTFTDSIKTHTTEQAFINDFVPNDQREEILLSDISQLAEDTEVDLFSVGFAEGKQGVRSSAATDGSAYLMEGKVIISGTYEDVKNFMDKLFRLERLYGFKTFDLTKPTQDKKQDENGEDVVQKLYLSGVASFTYGYIPGSVGAPNNIGDPINFDLINTVMESTAKTDELVTETESRNNPFLP